MTDDTSEPASKTTAITAQGPITWNEGGTAAIHFLNDVEVVFRSSVPYPPGKPARGSVRDGAMLYAFTTKIQRSTKVAEGVWEVRARLTSATVEVRAAFVSALASQSS